MTVRSLDQISPRIPHSAYVDETALVIGDVSLGEDASVWPMAVVRGDMQPISIGARSNVQDGCVLHVTHDGRYSPGGHALRMGDDVTVGHRAVLHGCTIDERCLIGIDAVILDGARVRAGTLIGAGSLVPPGKDLESGHLWVGRPARKVRALTPEELSFLEYSAAHYVRTKDRYLRG